PENVVGAMVSPGYLGKTFQVSIPLGRDFLTEEGELGKDREVILSHAFWQKHFGGDRNVLGSPLRMNDENYTIVGILPAGAFDRYEVQVWTPLAFKPEQMNHDFHWLAVAARLKPGVSVMQAQSEMDGVAKHIGEVYPKSNQSWGVQIER